MWKSAIVVMIMILIAFPAVPMINSPFISTQSEQKGEPTIISTDEQSEKSLVAEEFGGYKICFNCHVEAKGFGDCSVLFLKPLSESTYSAKWMHMWLYSDAEITVDDWHHSGRGAIYMLDYNGEYEFDDVNHTYTIDGKALFCFAMGRR